MQPAHMCLCFGAATLQEVGSILLAGITQPEGAPAAMVAATQPLHASIACPVMRVPSCPGLLLVSGLPLGAMVLGHCTPVGCCAAGKWGGVAAPSTMRITARAAGSVTILCETAPQPSNTSQCSDCSQRPHRCCVLNRWRQSGRARGRAAW